MAAIMAFALLYIKVLHVLGAFLLFLGFGGLFAVGDHRGVNKAVTALNGAGLLLLFLAGFALQGMGKYGFPLWLIVKIILWIAMAVIFVMTKQGKLSRTAGISLAVFFGAAAAWLCIVGRVTPGLM